MSRRHALARDRHFCTLIAGETAAFLFRLNVDNFSERPFILPGINRIRASCCESGRPQLQQPRRAAAADRGRVDSRKRIRW
jgi:hypothetical protein